MGDVIQNAIRVILVQEKKRAKKLTQTKLKKKKKKPCTQDNKKSYPLFAVNKMVDLARTQHKC